MSDLVVQVPPELGPMVAFFAAIGGLSAVLANRGVSVFHDGLRPLIPAMISGVVPRREVARTSFKLGLGFFWAFALPFSLGFTIPLVYLIFMATDWIGVSFDADHERPWYRTKRSLRGVGGALAIGALWSAAIAWLIHHAALVMADFPISMSAALAEVADPAIQAFFLFPVLTVAYQYGVRHGLVNFGLGSLAWFGTATLDAEQPGVWAFVVTLGYLLVVAARKVRASRPRADQDPDPDDILAQWEAEAAEDEAEDEWKQFRENIRRLKRSIIPSAALYALMGAAYNLAIMSNDPISGRLYAIGLVVPAALVMVAWGLSYVPMKFATAVVTGCMATGTFIEMGVAILMPNPWAAAAALAVLRVIEIYSLEPVVRFLDRFPDVREISETMRTAVFHVMEVGFLIGGGFVAAQFAGAFGFTAVVALWWLNNRANSPIMPMSVGAVGAVAVGLTANLLQAVGFQIPA